MTSKPNPISFLLRTRKKRDKLDYNYNYSNNSINILEFPGVSKMLENGLKWWFLIPKLKRFENWPPCCLPFTRPPALALLEVKNNLGRLLASILAQVWRNITKNTKNADFKKTVPPAASHLLAPLAPLGVKKIFGRFLASISAQVWRNITKNTKNADFKKTGPPAGPVYCPPCPPWGSKKFLGGVWHLVRSNPSHLAQKIRQNHQFWSNRCMTPSVAALCSIGE